MNQYCILSVVGLLLVVAGAWANPAPSHGITCFNGTSVSILLPNQTQPDAPPADGSALEQNCDSCGHMAVYGEVTVPDVSEPIGVNVYIYSCHRGEAREMAELSKNAADMLPPGVKLASAESACYESSTSSEGFVNGSFEVDTCTCCTDLCALDPYNNQCNIEFRWTGWTLQASLETDDPQEDICAKVTVLVMGSFIAAAAENATFDMSGNEASQAQGLVQMLNGAGINSTFPDPDVQALFTALDMAANNVIPTEMDQPTAVRLARIAACLTQMEKNMADDANSGSGSGSGSS